MPTLWRGSLPIGSRRTPRDRDREIAFEDARRRRQHRSRPLHCRLHPTRRCASAGRRPHGRVPTNRVFANNAGSVFGDPAKTVDGFEKTFQINHLAPFLLTTLLMDTLIASNASVIQTSSIGARMAGPIDIDDLDHDRKFDPVWAYNAAKLENNWSRKSSIAGITNRASRRQHSIRGTSRPVSEPSRRAG